MPDDYCDGVSDTQKYKMLGNGLDSRRYSTHIKRNKKMKHILKYSEEEVREAVDIAIGDDGHKSNEVIEILEHFKNEEQQLRSTKE